MYRVRFDVETLLVFGMHFKNAAHVMLRNDNAFKLTILLNAQVNLFDRIHRKKFNAIPSVVLSSSFSPPHSPPSFSFVCACKYVACIAMSKRERDYFLRFVMKRTERCNVHGVRMANLNW